ncbi:MAG: DUF2520 domain-containing protein [Myxococcota bacterium]
MVEQLARTEFVAGDAVVAHTSGLHSSDVLAPLMRAKASLHPMVACANAEVARWALREAIIRWRGDALALHRLTQFVRNDLGGQVCCISAAMKPQYHAYCVMVSGLLVAPMDIALGEAKVFGFGEVADGLRALAQGALDRFSELGAVNAITGPCVRGDAGTVAANCGAAHLIPEYLSNPVASCLGSCQRTWA